MGNKAVKSDKKTSKKARAATFRVIEKQAGKRHFVAVNKRAKALTAAVTGELTTANLKGIKKLGFRVLESPSLKAIKL